MPGDRPARGRRGASRERLVGRRYRLEERLGTGGTADVWRATDTRTADTVAVKLLHPYLLPDASSRERFAAEARSAAELDHPGIVGPRDVVLGADEAALVLDYVGGGSLADRLQRDGALPPREAARITAQVADALAAAHARGVIHRDVTPGNVLLEPDGRARLADFGIARSLEGSSAGLTVTGTVMGTLRYMAPEQLAGEPADERTDIYALGAVLYELLAGRPAFDARNPVLLVDQQRAAPPPIAGVDPALAGVALAALRRDPAERPDSAAAVGEALRAWLDRGTVPAAALLGGADAAAVTRAVPLPVSGAIAAATAGVARPAASPRRQRPRNVPLAALALAALLVGGGLVALAGSGSHPPVTAAAKPTPAPVAASPTASSTAKPTPVPKAPAPPPAHHGPGHRHGGGGGAAGEGDG